MKKEIFAKIFELDECQVLITKEDGDEDETFKVIQTTDIDGIRASMGLGFNEVDKREECFNKYNESNAKKFSESVKDLLV